MRAVDVAILNLCDVRSHLIAPFRPTSHHPDALVPIVGSRIRPPDAVSVNMGELTLDSVGMPTAAFVQKGGRGGAEAMARHFVLAVAHPPKG